MLQSTLPTLSVRSHSQRATKEPLWEKTTMHSWIELKMCLPVKTLGPGTVLFSSYQIRALSNCDSKVPPVEEGKVSSPKPEGGT